MSNVHAYRHATACVWMSYSNYEVPVSTDLVPPLAVFLTKPQVP